VEVIVVDDGSTDDTPSVAATFRDRIVYIRQPNQGLSAARNTGIMVAHADLVQLLDSDDALHPRAVQLATEAADRYPGAAVFAGGWDDVDVAGRALAHARAPVLLGDTFHVLFDVMQIGPASRYCVRRAAVASAGLFDTRLRACEDWDMWLRMAAAGLQFIALPGTTVRYRNYATSMSKRPRLMWQSGITVLEHAAQVHGDCGDCRRARQRGVVQFRDWCYVSMVAPRIRAAWEQRRYYAAGRELVAAFGRDPRVMPLLLRSSRSHWLGGRP
jgi:glycosyltransferase involved in cell wall biosynthesis